MDNFRFYIPTEVIFGRGTEAQVGAVAGKYGSRALLVYGKGSVVRSGLLSRVEASLTQAGIPYKEFGGAQPNPTLAHAEEGVREAVSFGADMIIAVGGGSAIDTAKGIAHGAANPDTPLWELWTKKVPLTRSLPVGAVLTMPAAGSEMSDSAVLTNTALGRKAGINTEFNRCRFAVMNPEWGATLPRFQLAAGVTDITVLREDEQRGVLRPQTVGDRRQLGKVLDLRVHVVGRQDVQFLRLGGGRQRECGRGKDFSVHKLGHPLSARFGVTHGASLAAVWGAWAEELYRDCPSRFARFARRVWSVAEVDDLAAAKAGINITVDFFSSIGMPVNLQELNVGITEADMPQLSLDATLNDTLKLSRIRPLTAADAERIYRRALRSR